MIENRKINAIKKTEKYVVQTGYRFRQLKD
jgi:hypothetical protein